MGRINPYHKATQKPCFLKFQQKEDQDRGSSVQKQEEDDSNQDHSGHDNFLPTQNFVFPKRVVENDQNQETPRRRFTEYEKGWENFTKEERKQIILPQIRWENFEDELEVQEDEADAFITQLKSITQDRNANYTFVIKMQASKSAPKLINILAWLWTPNGVSRREKIIKKWINYCKWVETKPKWTDQMWRNNIFTGDIECSRSYPQYWLVDSNPDFEIHLVQPMEGLNPVQPRAVERKCSYLPRSQQMLLQDLAKLRFKESLSNQDKNSSPGGWTKNGTNMSRIGL